MRCENATELGTVYTPDELKALEHILGRGVTLGELTLAPRSGAIGRTLRDLDFRKRTGLNVVSIWRRDDVRTAGLAETELRLGDAFLVSGPPPRLRAMRDDPDLQQRYLGV